MPRAGRRPPCRAARPSSAWRKSAESSSVTFASSARTTPSGVTISGLISAERRVRLDEARVELPGDLLDLRAFALVVQRGEQLAEVVRLEPLERVDVDAHERVRVLGGDLLDLDAALGREHQQRRPAPRSSATDR